MHSLDLSYNDAILIQKALEIANQVEGLGFSEEDKERALDILEQLEDLDYEELHFEE